MRYSYIRWTVVPIVVLLLFSTLLSPLHSNAETKIQASCGYIPEEGINPPLATINCLLTEIALKYDIPPEIIKAIAEQESGWKQFNDHGEPLISDDGGIGMMQITLTNGLDEEELQTNLLYNIEAGVQNLNASFGRRDLPIVNDRSRRTIENWYFAIMAYNGIKPVNSPVYQETGSRNHEAYQEQVMEIIRNRSLLDIAKGPFESSDFNYDREDDSNIQFVTKSFQFVDQPLQTSKYYFKANDIAYINGTNVRVRQQPTTTSNVVKTASQNEAVTVTGPFEYDSVNPSNHFVWYPVTLSGGTTGYVAASYLNDTKVTPVVNATWKEWPTAHNISNNKVWNVELNTKLAEQSIHTENIYIMNSAGERIPIQLSLSANRNTIVITPVQRYQSGESYTLYLKDIESMSGKKIKDNVKMKFITQ